MKWELLATLGIITGTIFIIVVTVWFIREILDITYNFDVDIISQISLITLLVIIAFWIVLGLVIGISAIWGNLIIY